MADGLFGSSSGIVSYRLTEIVHHYVSLPGGFYYSPIFIVMNKTKWAALPAADQAAIKGISGETVARALVSPPEVPADRLAALRRAFDETVKDQQFLAEADKICVLLTRQSGKLRGIAYGARKMRSRFGSSLEPFTEISLTYFEKEGRELVSISNAEIVRSHFNEASETVEAGAAMSYFSDMLCEFLPDHEPNETIYRLVEVPEVARPRRRYPLRYGRDGRIYTTFGGR